MLFGSIRARLTASIAALLALLVVVSVFAAMSLIKIDRRVETIDRTWLAGTQILGALKNTVSEFRVAEGYRVLAKDSPSALQSEFLAERYATGVRDLLERFKALSRDAALADDLQRFEVAWQAMLKQHRDWIAAAGGGPMNSVESYGSALQKRYEAVQLAAGNLIDDAKAAASAEAEAANAGARRATTLVLALALLAGLLTTGLMVHIDRWIARPLGAITAALSRLAADDREISLPEIHRSDEIGTMAKAFEVFRRNAVALEQAQKRAEALARHDVLTGLPNRRLFASELDAALKSAEGGLTCIVMLVGLDRFKPVNDLHGHAAGDHVLCEVASRLRDLVGRGGTLARLGGDEFAVIMPPLADRRAALDGAIGLAARIVAGVAVPMDVNGLSMMIGASIGLSVYPLDGLTAEDVLRAAGLAMYRAKHDGRGLYRFFEDSMDAELRAKAQLEADVRLAIDAEAIEPYYQPLVDLGSNRIAGFEVLARWHHAERGFVAPDLFIPVVEQIGALNRMTESVLRRVFDDARHWNADIRVAVNISPAQFQDVGFLALVAAILMATGFPPRRLEIEVTETALVGDLRAAKFTLGALQKFGISVVLDDFGTGYSSLSHLRELKFDKIKIDRSFIRTMAENPDSETIVDAVLGLARNLGMPAVAEGIETPDVLHMLARRGCAYGQGFLFSKAVPAAQAGAMLNGQPERPLQRKVG